MESNQSTQQGEQRRAMLVSGKLFNNDDGPIWPTGQMTPYRLKPL